MKHQKEIHFEMHPTIWYEAKNGYEEIENKKYCACNLQVTKIHGLQSYTFFFQALKLPDFSRARFIQR